MTWRPVALAAIVLCFALLPGAGIAFAQRQLPDLDFAFANADPAYEAASGPVIAVSTLNSPLVQRGDYDPLIKLAGTDGFRAARKDGTLSEVLAGKPDILVIINAYLPSYANFPAMDPPSAFSADDIEAVHKWVDGGGSLLILADHAPFGGGSSKLAALFGFTFLNGHVAEDRSAAAGFVHVDIDFTPENGLNTDHPITNGGMGRKPISHFFAFGGQGFIPPDGATTLLRIPNGWSAIFSYAIERELRSAPRIDAGGMSQGAVMNFGKGRVAVFGEAGGFSAQIVDRVDRFGFNSALGKDNPDFVLSVLRWLARYKKKD